VDRRSGLPITHVHMYL